MRAAARRAVAVLGLLVLASRPAFGQTSGQWNTDANGNYSVGGNWLGGVPNGGGTATFGGVVTANRTITLDINPLLSGMVFNNTSSAGGYTLTTTSNFLTLSSAATITNGSPNATAVNVPVTLQGNLTIGGSGVGQITLGGVISESAVSGIVVNTSAGYPDVGVVVLSGANTFTGGVTLQAGTVQIANNSALGTGTLTINGGYLRGGVPTATSITNAVQLNSDLIVSGGSLTIANVIDDGAGTFRAVNLSGALTLSAANTYGGATALGRPADLAATLPLRTGATTTFVGAGSALNSSGFEVNGGGLLLLDNRSAANAFSRISSTAPVALNNSTIRIFGGTATSGSFTQNTGLLTGTGFSEVSVALNSFSSEGLTLNFTALSRGPTGTGTFQFTFPNALSSNIGVAPGAGVARLTFGTAPPTIGGALGTNGAAIIPFAVSSSGYLTYGANGVRPLQAGESVTNAMTANTNVVLTSGVQTLNADRAINSLFFGATGTGVTGTGTLTVTSGAIGGLSGSATASVGNNLDFGTAQANVVVGPTATDFSTALALNGQVRGSGGLTVSGMGTLFLAAGNTYTGTTAISGTSVLIYDQSAFGLSTSAIELNGKASVPSSLALPEIGIPSNVGGLAMNLTRPLVVSNGNAVLSGYGARSVLLVSGPISGNGGLFFQGNDQSAAGMTFLVGTNTHTGGTNVSSGVSLGGYYTGNVAWASDSNLGASTGLLGLGTNSDTSGQTTGAVLMGNWTTTRPVNLYGSTKLDTNGFDATLQGRLSSDGASSSPAFYKAGAGTLTLSNIGVSGMTPELDINGGAVVLSGNSKLTRAAGFVLRSGTLLLDNTGAGVNDRLNTAAALRFASEGTGTFQIDAGTNAVTQNLAAINVGGQAAGRVVLTAGAGGSARLTLTNSTGYSITNSSSLFVSGDGLVNTSTAASMGQSGVVFAGSLPPSQNNVQMAGNGAAGTSTVGILRGGYGARTTNGGSPSYGLLTQTSANVGVRLLDESTEYANTQVANANVRIQGSTPVFSGATAINSVSLRNGSALAITSGDTLTVASGTFLSTGSTSGSPNLIQSNQPHGGGAVLTSNTYFTINSGFVFATVTDLEVRAALLGNGSSSSLVKVDVGTLTFNPLDAAGNPVGSTNVTETHIFGGTLRMPANQTIANLPGNIYIADGATFQYLGAGATTGKSFGLTGAGGTLDLTGTFLQFTCGDRTITNGFGGSGVTGNGGTLRLTGGTLILGSGTTGTPAAVQRNTYEDGTNLIGGTLVLNADSTLGDATGTPLGLGPLRLMGGQLAPKFATRDVAVPVEVLNGTVFINRTTPGGADTSNAGLRFLAPVRLENSVTLTNNMTGGDLTFAGSVYDNPYKSPAGVTFAAGAGAGATVLQFPNVYRGDTVVAGGTLRVENTLGSATGSGNVTVNTGARLTSAATGFLVPANGGTVTVNGTLSPGNGVGTIGTLTVGAADRAVAVSVSGAQSRYTFTITATNAGSATPLADGSSSIAVGISNNLLWVLGNGTSSLTFAPATLELDDPVAGLGANWDPAKYYSWKLARVTGGTAVSGPGALDLSNFHNTTAANSTFSLAVSGEFVVLSYSPVPEPAAVLAIGVVVSAVGAVGRRRAGCRVGGD